MFFLLKPNYRLAVTVFFFLLSAGPLSFSVNSPINRADQLNFTIKH